ncbi:MAG: outer rane adhesin like protein [Acidimicrobiales bacterium]|nr:outer rane adhesin like protein [Acidimicrobiales bacterium]
MGTRSALGRVGLVVGLVASSLTLALTLGSAPAAAAAPTVEAFMPETKGLSVYQNAGAGTFVQMVKATWIVKHDAGDTVTGLRFNTNGADPTGAYSSAGLGTVSEIPGTAGSGSDRAVVQMAFDPGNNFMGFDGTDTRARARNVRVQLQMSDGQVTPVQSWDIVGAPEWDSGNEDYPVPYQSTGSTGSTVSLAPGATVTIAYGCDDNDGSGAGSAGDCDSAALRYRRLSDGAITNLVCSNKLSGDGCENRTGATNGFFNADDNTTRTYGMAGPTGRGRYVVEAKFCNSNGNCPSGPKAVQTEDYRWYVITSFLVNTPTTPTVLLAGTASLPGTATASTFAHPATGATITATATTSSDAQVLDLDLDNNGSFENRVSGTGGTATARTLTAAEKAANVDLSGRVAGTDCSVKARVVDNGAISAADVTSLTSATTSALACTTNRLPTGGAQSGVSATKATPTTISLTSADTDSDPRTCQIVSAPSKGTFSQSGGSPDTNCTVSYTASPNTSGSDSFTYRVLDDHNGTSASTYTVGIDIVNTAPTGSTSPTTVAATPRGSSTVFNLVPADANGDDLTVSIPAGGQPAVGTVSCPSLPATLSGPSYGSVECTYTVPANSPIGARSLTWRISDGFTSTDVTTALSVTNTAPTATGATTNAQRGRPAAETSFSLSGADVNGDTLTYAVTAGPSVGTLTCSTGGSCTYTVPPDTALGEVTFSWVASDGLATSGAAVQVLAVGNTAPQADNVGPLHTQVGDVLPTPLVGTDFNGDTLTYAGPVTGPAKGVVAGTGAARTYTAASGTKGADSFTYTASDNEPSTSAEGTVSIVIDNTAPVATPQSTSAARGIATTVTVAGTDANADALSFAVSGSGPAKGIATCQADGTCTYTAGPGQSGTDSFQFVANDGTENSAPATVTITITNDDPVAAAQAVDVPRRVATSITVTGTDPNGDPLTYSGPTTGPSKGSLTCAGSGACSYTSDEGETGSDSFTFTADDGFGGTDTATVTITLTNSAPTADAQAVDAPREVATGISLGGSDPNLDDLTYAVETEPTKGTVSCDGDGACTYTSGSGETGADSFTFTATDPDGISDAATVAITLTNTAPTGDAASYNVTKGIPKSFVLTGQDANNDALTFTVESPPTGGNVSCTGAVCSYTATITTGTDSFTFVAHDGFGGDSAPATVTLNVGPPRITISDAQVLEPDPGSPTVGVMVPVAMSSPAATTLTVSYYTVNGTATGAAGKTADYQTWGTPATPRTVTMAAGSNWVAISPPIVADTISEPNEFFEIHIVSVTAANGSVVAFGDGVSRVEIIDNLPESADPVLVAHDLWTYESDNAAGQKAQVTIQFSKPTTQSMELQFVFGNGTALGGTTSAFDYKKSSTVKMTVPAGVMMRTLDFSLWGDTVVEDNETLTVQVIPTDGSPVIQADLIANVLVLNDD